VGQELGGALFQRKPLIALTVLGDAVHPYLDRIAQNATMRARPRSRWPTCGGQHLCHCSRLVSVAHDETAAVELQLENSRLRRLVTDILLETIKLEEAAQSATGLRTGTPKGHHRKAAGWRQGLGG